MIEFRDAMRLSALGAILGLATTPSVAASRFDGAWSVVATTETGSCTGPYRYPIVIRDGNVDDAGENGIDAAGRTAADGRIRGTIRKGLANVLVAGRLRGSGGSGRWTLSGLASCSGSWTARRTS